MIGIEHKAARTHLSSVGSDNAGKKGRRLPNVPSDTFLRQYRYVMTPGLFRALMSASQGAGQLVTATCPTDWESRDRGDQSERTIGRFSL